ncbi:hypothetical protein CWB41_13430 [Methylovirgula ligni]|nr:hypothetical protein CWB41_13430 [Methylovirgula ligni]
MNGGLIATPGRLLDFSERGKLLLTSIKILACSAETCTASAALSFGNQPLSGNEALSWPLPICTFSNLIMCAGFGDAKFAAATARRNKERRMQWERF